MNRTMRGAALMAAMAATTAAAYAGDNLFGLGKKAGPAKGEPSVPPVALVNGEAITREQLAQELIDTYGAQQLDVMISRKLVEQACKTAKVEVTHKDIEADVEKTLKSMQMDRKTFAQRVLQQRGMTYGQHLRDNVWPKVAMVKLVEGRVKVTDQDLAKGFEATYGAKVEVRMLAVLEMNRAKDLWEKMMAIPAGEKRLKAFEDACKEFSIDAASRPYAGKVAPINKNSSNPELEKTIFDLKDGDVSPIIPIGGGNVIFLCVKHLPPQDDVTLDTVINATTKETVRQALSEGIYAKKLQYEATVFFEQSRKQAHIENFLSGDFNEEAVKVAAPEPGSAAPVPR